MTPDLQSHILTQIARATSRRPARATEVLALVGGPAPAFWRALEQLVDTRQVATAHIQRPRHDAEPWLAIWPTGVHQGASGWTGNSHNYLFVPTPATGIAAHKAQAPRVRPAPSPALASGRSRSPFQTRIVAAVRGHGRTQPLPVPVLARSLGVLVENLTRSVRTLEGDGEVGILRVPYTDAAGRRRIVRAVYDPAVAA